MACRRWDSVLEPATHKWAGQRRARGVNRLWLHGFEMGQSSQQKLLTSCFQLSTVVSKVGMLKPATSAAVLASMGSHSSAFADPWVGRRISSVRHWGTAWPANYQRAVACRCGLG
jgi:hypothetical protein